MERNLISGSVLKTVLYFSLPYISSYFLQVLYGMADLFATISIISTIVLLILTKPIVALMSTPVEAVLETEYYLMICFIGIPFITAYNILSSVFRGMGDSKSPMYFIAIA